MKALIALHVVPPGDHVKIPLEEN